MGMEEWAVYGATAAFIVAVVWHYVRKGQTASATVAAKVEEAKATGRFEPVSLYPHINPSACIGSGACVRACPEKDILGLVDGKATVINTSSCVGHGACFMACPVDAITLRIGTAQRGVDLPHVKPTYESNVDGLYIAGELGGMGLIKNSAEQGVQAVESLLKQRRPTPAGAVDVAIVGAGPAGIAAALAARRAGLSFALLEQDSLGGTVFTFPRSKLVMTSPMDLPLHGKVKLTDTSKGELLELWQGILSEHDIPVQEHTKVESIARGEDGAFELALSTGTPCRAAHVVLAIGRRGTPRKLGVPGETNNEKVAYRLLDPELIAGEDILVVGGGDSAVEAVLMLMEANRVHLSYRKTSFNRIKPGNQTALQAAMDRDAFTPHLGTEVEAIGPDHVTLKDSGTRIPYDRIYIFAGGELPTDFLRKAGIEVEKTFGKVVRRHALALAGLLVSCSLAWGQFSPGELTSAHAELEGMGNCTQCHEVGAKISEARCLDCHEVLQERIELRQGFHATSEVTSQRCEDCHNEHHGRTFELIRFDTVAFIHSAQAGWRLEGAHGQVDCRACHQPEHVRDERLADRPGSFLGLSTECLACHEDVHAGTLPTTCLDCHSMDAFEGAERFDHDAADFALTGAHREVDCAACHTSEPEFPSLAHAACTDCHEDVHDGALGPRCTDCHSTASWLGSADGFDHNTTDYPLEGQHAVLACASCHTTRPARAMPFERCTDCHDDYHEGELGAEPDCAECHTVMAPFTRTEFGLADHNEGPYPLTGAHAATPCFACHKPDADARWDFRLEDQTCTACHDNVHESTLAAWTSTACTDCHDTESWRAIAFDHATTAWPLEGAHSAVQCRDCHGTVDAGQTFTDLPATCASCHDNVHGDQFGEPADCAACHTPASEWRADRFDHSTTAFPLDGQHAEADCSSCHTAASGVVVYSLPSFECADCHAN